MATRKISTTLAVEGETAFKQAIAACNSTLAALKSSLAATESEFRNSANTLKALTEKEKSFNELKTKQTEKIEKLENALKNCQNALKKYKDEHDKLQPELTASDQAVAALGDTTKKAGEQWAAYAAELDNGQRRLGALKGMARDTSAAQAQLETDLAKTREEMAKLEASTGGAAKQAGELIRENKNLRDSYDSNEAKLEAATRGVNNWEKQLNNAKIAANQLDDEIAQNNQYLAEARASADGCATSIDQYGKEVKKAGEASEDFGDRAKAGVEQLAGVLAAAGIAKGVGEITSALLDCSEAAKGFEKTIGKIDTIAEVPRASLEEMRGQIISLSGDTGKAADTVSEAVYQAISSGAEASKAVGTVEKSAKLAAGGFTSVETAVDVLTTSLNAYKLQASETERISDILITTQKKGKTTVDELGQSVGKVIPLAAAYNVQMDNLGASYAILTAGGIATAEAGTYIKSMLKELGDSGSKAAGILKDKTGKSFAELTKSGRSMGDVLAVLGDSVGGSTEAFTQLWSSTEAGIGALSLFNSGADHFNDVLAEMQNSAGATEAAYRKMASTTEFADQRMHNAADNLSIVVGEQLNPALKELYNTGADAFTWAAEFVEENPWVVGAISAVTIGLGTMTVGLTLSANAAGIAAAAHTALNAVMNANPAFLVATGVTALAAAITAYSLSTSSADTRTRELTRSIKESKAAYEELTASIKEENGSVSASVKALKDLLAAEDKSAARKEQILRLVDKLNDAMPELELAYDETADAINMTSDALDRAAQSMAADQEHEAQVDRLAELRVEYQELGDQAAETQEKLDGALSEAQWDSFGGAVNDAANQVSLLQSNMESLTAAQADAAAQIAELEAAVGAYSQQQADSAVSTEDMTQRVDALVGQVQTLDEAYQTSYGSAYESISGQVGLFQELDGAANTSIGNLIESLKGQVAYMESYSENIRKAMELGVDEGLVRKLSDGSEESARILDAIVQGSAEDIRELNEELAKVEEGKEDFANTVAEMETDFQAKMKELTEDLEDAVRDMDLKDDAYKAGWNNIQGLIDGTAAQKRALVAKYAEMGKAAIAAYKKAVDQHSPSREFRKAGSYDIEGIIQGAEARKAQLDEAYRDMARTALESMERNLPRYILDPGAALRNQRDAALDAAVKRLDAESRTAGQGSGVSAKELAGAVREALDGAAVNMSGRKVGELVTAWQRNNNRSMGV